MHVPKMITSRWSYECYFALLLVCSIASLSRVVSAAHSINTNETDRLALLKFKSKITADPLGIMTSWNHTTHFCKWFGITCGKLHQRVTGLNLRSMQLVGSISPYIGNLTFLRILDLTNNSLFNPIPPEIGYLRRLKTLYLYNNSLSGEIPSNLCRCKELSILSLVNNEFVGAIPKELGSLSKLQFMSIAKNDLTGEIPPSLGNLSSLSSLSLEMNNLVGRIPDAIGQLHQLTFLGLGVNQLSGEVPYSIFNLSLITVLDVGDCHLQGRLPPDLFITLPHLHEFAIALNQFTGPIPPSMSNASNLRSIQLQNNLFRGTVPSLQRLNGLYLFLINHNPLGVSGHNSLNFLCELTNATDLQIIDISANNLEGSLPGCIANLTSKLTEMSLYENHIHGNIPLGVSNLVGLERFRVYSNLLSSTIPHTIGSLQNLFEMILDQNYFSGAIPESIGNMSNLNRFHMADNNISGTIPPSLKNCKYLQVMDLSRNNLSGTLPPEVIGLSSLSIYLGFSQNQLTGSLPREIGQLIQLGILDVSHNMFSGEIPGSLGSCLSLVDLYMMGNHFQGPIPPSLSSLRGLEVLTLSHNNLSGEIPEFLGSFKSLIYLDLSYNDFEGSVPTDGKFRNASVVSLKGNNKLCGGIPQFQLPPCEIKSKKKRLSTKLKVGIATGSGILAVVSLLCLIFVIRSRKKTQAPASSPSVYSLLQASYWDLHRATNGFSSDNLIGMGRFASVYKGILQEGEGALFAIKVFKLHHRGAAKSFMTECEAMRSIRHRNLVKVITACSSTDYQGNEFKAIVYEFMPNGSLEDWLHPVTDISDTQETPKHLTLLQRLSIALDVASALEYLHYRCETPVVHCDLKPSNVLLDDELVAHVSDFGIAKLLSEDGYGNSLVNLSSSIGLRGTKDTYLQYGVGSEVSIHGDVYSYGILVLEMFTGKRPTDDMFEEGQSLHKYAKRGLSDGIAKIIDPILAEGEPNLRTEDKIMEYLTCIFEIGVACSAEYPRERLSINEAIRRLHSIKLELLRLQSWQ